MTRIRSNSSSCHTYSVVIISSFYLIIFCNGLIIHNRPATLYLSENTIFIFIHMLECICRLWYILTIIVTKNTVIGVILVLFFALLRKIIILIFFKNNIPFNIFDQIFIIWIRFSSNKVKITERILVI